MTELVVAAARNNAALCAAVCEAHGIVGTRDAEAWTSPRRTPPLHPDAVTTAAGVDACRLLARVDAGDGCSVKDSFSDLQLWDQGFRVLFDALWLVRHPQPAPRPTPGLRWGRVTEERDLETWVRGWRSTGGAPDVLTPALLRGGLDVLAGYHDGTLVAGAIACRTDGVVGVSNLFGLGAATAQLWPGCLRAVHDLHPGLPVVGYASGAAAEGAVRHGFTPVGPLRVWVRDGGQPPSEGVATSARGDAAAGASRREPAPPGATAPPPERHGHRSGQSS